MVIYVWANFKIS